MLVQEYTPVADTVLPVERLKDHLRLASGFAEDHVQDALLAGFLRAAMATIEGRISRKLLQREFILEVTAPLGSRNKPIPLSPVVRLLAVEALNADGTSAQLPLESVGLIRSSDASHLACNPFPPIPAGGAVRLTLLAGMSENFDLLQADLAQAVMLLASHYYEYRTQTQLGSGCMPFGVTALIDQYRPVRIGLGQV